MEREPTARKPDQAAEGKEREKSG
eukprot:COSAG06_NODE_41388_length_392_cov_0.662116_2_plen_23_part_01